MPTWAWRPACSVRSRTESTAASSSSPSISPRWTSRPTSPLTIAAASLMRVACSVSALWANRFPSSTWRSSSCSGSATAYCPARSSMKISTGPRAAFVRCASRNSVLGIMASKSFQIRLSVTQLYLRQTDGRSS